MFGMSKLMMGNNGGGGGGGYYFEYTDNKQNNSTATSYTFTTTQLGTPDTDRMIIISAVTTGSVGGSGIPSTLTVGGVSLTKADGIQQPFGFSYCASAIFYGKIATGTSAAVVVTPAAQTLGCRIAVYAYKTTQSAPLSIGKSGGLNDLVLDCVPYGIAIHSSGNNATSGRTNIWTGIDPIVDDVNTAWDSKWIAFSHVETTETSSVRAFDVTGGSGYARVGVSFGP